MMRRGAAAALVALVAGCAGGPAAAPDAKNASVPSPPPVTAGREAPNPSPTPPVLRLPTDARPLRHAATLTIVPTEDTFEAEIAIALDVQKALSVLWLNADGLMIAHAEARIGGKTIAARVVPGGDDFVGLAFDAPLPVGRDASVRIEYRGKLSASEINGATRQQEGGDWYAFTHFEPIAARRVFPCFDEPSFKAPWQLTLKVRAADAAFSNTPVESTSNGTDGFKTVRFAETKPLPSYLVAFAVGPFGVVDAGKVGAAPVRILTPRGKETYARYAAGITGKVLAALEGYFGAPYPYEKVDVIAVPQFGGAMENPGLVTFRQSLLLAKPELESATFRRWYTEVAAHELAHQWFGDQVTMAWWDDIWLNEAFATWMTPKIVAGLRPDWDSPSQTAAESDGAMRADSLVTARRIRQPIASKDDITNAFDGITYEKGAAVIGMFERWVGVDPFQRGVRRYMREHANGTATARDFLGAISAEAGRDVAPAFSTFLDQAGVPQVSAALRCDPSGAKVALSATRYLPEGSVGGAGAWETPVCVRAGAHGKSERACARLDGAAGELPLAACPEWLLLNDGASGYYRSDYGNDLARKITFAEGGLTGPEKIALLGDFRALAQAKRLDYAALLRLVPALARDTNPLVARAAAWPVGELRDRGLVDEPTRPRYARFIRTTFGPRLRAIGLLPKAGDSDGTRALRVTLVDLLADQGEDPEVRALCTKLAHAWLGDRTSVPPEMATTALAIAANTGDRALFEAYVAEAKKTPERAEREKLLYVIGSFRDPGVLGSALALLLSGDFDVREAMRITWGATELPEGAALAYDFVTSHFDELVRRLPRDSAAGFPSIGARTCDEGRRAQIEAYFGERSKRFVGGPRDLAQALENLHLCAAAKASQGPGVAAFFAK